MNKLLIKYVQLNNKNVTFKLLNDISSIITTQNRNSTTLEFIYRNGPTSINADIKETNKEHPCGKIIITFIQTELRRTLH